MDLWHCGELANPTDVVIANDAGRPTRARNQDQLPRSAKRPANSTRSWHARGRLLRAQTDVERWNGILHLRTGRNQRPFLYADPIVRDRIRSANSLFPPVPLDGSIFRRDSPSLWGGSPAVLFHGTTGAGVPHRGRTDAYPPATRGDCDSGYRPSTRRGIGNNTQCRNVRSKCQCSMCLQFTLVLAASCVLHRPMSLVIHR